MVISAAIFMMSTSTIQAQIGFSLNISSQPQWGPTNYDHVEYYYMPEYGIYYYAPGAQFVYQVGSRWAYSSTLPYRYRNVNLYATHKIVVNESKPYLRNDYYANKYKKNDYRYMHSRQEVIRDSRDDRYRDNNSHNNNNYYKNNSDNKMEKYYHDHAMQYQGYKGNNNDSRDNNGNSKGNKKSNKKK